MWTTADGYLPIVLEEEELRAFRVVGVFVRTLWFYEVPSVGYQVQCTMYKVQCTKYKVQSTKYFQNQDCGRQVRSERREARSKREYQVVSTKYNVPSTLPAAGRQVLSKPWLRRLSKSEIAFLCGLSADRQAWRLCERKSGNPPSPLSYSRCRYSGNSSLHPNQLFLNFNFIFKWKQSTCNQLIAIKIRISNKIVNHGLALA